MASKKAIQFLDRVLKKHAIATPPNYNELLDLCAASIDDGKFDKQNLQKNVLKPWAEQSIEGNLVDRYTKLLSMGRGITKERLILIYGLEEGERRWGTYTNKHRFKNTREGKLAKYGWDDIQFDSYNKSRAVTKTNLIKKYGKEEGEQRWGQYVEKQKVNGSSVGWFVSKYGDTVGLVMYEEVCKAKGHTLENYVKRFGTAEGTLRFEQYNTVSRHVYSSKSANAFFEELHNILNSKLKEYSSLSVYFAQKSKEFCKFDKSSNKVYFYDYALPEYKIIVEYNGDLFHANPKIYESATIPPFRGNTLTASEMWKRDKLKHDAAASHGFDILYVWESDVKSNKDAELVRIVNEICNRANQLRG